MKKMWVMTSVETLVITHIFWILVLAFLICNILNV